MPFSSSSKSSTSITHSSKSSSGGIWSSSSSRTTYSSLPNHTFSTNQSTPVVNSTRTENLSAKIELKPEKHTQPNNSWFGRFSSKNNQDDGKEQKQFPVATPVLTPTPTTTSNLVPNIPMTVVSRDTLKEELLIMLLLA